MLTTASFNFVIFREALLQLDVPFIQYCRRLVDTSVFHHTAYTHINNLNQNITGCSVSRKKVTPPPFPLPFSPPGKWGSWELGRKNFEILDCCT